MNEFEEFYDISPLVSSRTAVFPGDQVFERNVSMSFQNGDHLELSSIKTTLHMGAHIDAHSHFHPKGKTISEKDISRYLGPCQVVSVEQENPSPISLNDFDIESITKPRVLFKTGTFPAPEVWVDSFSSVAPETVRALSKKGVFLIGIDTPSVDPSDSKTLDGHHSFYNHDICNLEGVTLDKVSDGHYMLSCFPLKIEGAEASPVRAILFR